MKEKKKKTSLFLKINQMLWKNAGLKKFRALYYYLDAFLLMFKKKPKKLDGERKRVLVIYNLAFGDGMMWLGASKYLRKLYPEDKYELTIAVQKAFASLYLESGIYDNVIALDFSHATVNLGERSRLFSKLRAVHYDILIDPVGAEDYTSNIFASRAALADEKIGFLDYSLPKIHTSKRARRRIYSRLIELPEQESTRQLLSYYCEALSILADKSFPPRLAEFDKIELPFDTPDKFFIVFPSASMPVKGWSIDNFASLAERIQVKTGLPLVVCGTNHDRPSIDSFVQKLPEGITVIDYVGKTSLTEFIELIGRASMIITNDTSAYHIGVAKCVPTFMLAGGYTFSRYASYDAELIGCPAPHLIHNKMECYNCNNFCIHSGFDVFPCIEGISLDNAWNEVSNIIEKENIVQ